MAGEKLFTSQASPALGSFDPIGSESRSLGVLWSCTASGQYLTGGGIPVVSGVFPQRWQIWDHAGASRLLNLDMTALDPAPSGTGWHYFTFEELGQAPFPLTEDLVYVCNTWTPAGPGNYVYKLDGFSWPFGDSPLITASPGSIFDNNISVDTMPSNNSISNLLFYADVVLGDGPAPGSSAPKRPLSVPLAASQLSRW